MKIRIDDVRFPPDDTWDDSITEYIKAGKRMAAVNELMLKLIIYNPDKMLDGVEEISFDHDMGDDENFNGYELLKLVLQYYKVSGRELPKISIHSANSVAVERMERLLSDFTQGLN